MRQIKFRVWDKISKKMYWFDLRWGGAGRQGSGWIYALPIGEELKSDFYNSDNRVTLDPCNCEFMQFTGLLDKNGKEIYDDDLIQNETGRICKVKWCDAYSCWDAKPVNNIGNAFGFNCEVWRHCIEVIGNIYENAELFKEPLAK